MISEISDYSCCLRRVYASTCCLHFSTNALCPCYQATSSSLSIESSETEEASEEELAREDRKKERARRRNGIFFHESSALGRKRIEITDQVGICRKGSTGYQMFCLGCDKQWSGRAYDRAIRRALNCSVRISATCILFICSTLFLTLGFEKQMAGGLCGGTG